MLCMCIRIHSALLPSYCTSPMAVLMLELCSHNARGWVAGDSTAAVPAARCCWHCSQGTQLH